VSFNPLRNIVLKVSAVALALLLWVHVATNKTYEYQLNLPLSVVGVPKGLILLSDVPSIAAIKVRATGKQLLLLSSTDPALVISVADGKNGTIEKTIGATELAEALGHSVENAEVLFPRSLTLKFERETQKKLPVRVGALTLPAPGFALVRTPQVEPESVTVSGPAPIVHQLRHLETVPLSIEDLIASATRRVSLALPESLHLSLADSTVNVHFEVERALQKSFPNVPITPPAGFPISRYDIVPSHLSLAVNIPQSRQSLLTPASVAATFMRPSLSSDTIRAAVEYSLPSGATIVGAKADSVTLIKKP
jgi:YbbR domain-containing protein